jgi:hypothetical protein
MHCSICGKPNHNKKGHDKYIAALNLNGGVDMDNKDEEDDPSIFEVCLLVVLLLHLTYVYLS